MNENYKVTIIVPIYNVEQYIEKCIESILNQTHKNIEIILVDDGSTDACGSICDQYKNRDERVKVIHKRNGGLSSARNAGLEIATGEYISYVDSDDYVNESFIEELLDLCLKYNKKLSCINFCEFFVENEKDIKEENFQITIYNENDMIQEIVNRERTNNVTYCVWSKLFHRDIIENMRFPEGKTYEDILYTTKAVVNAKGCVYKSNVLYNYRIREGSISKSHYKEGFDTKLLTDRLDIQIKQLQYIRDNISERLSNIVKFEYYDEMINIYRINQSTKWEKIIFCALKKFNMPISDIIRLPYTSRRKLNGIIKMKFPQLMKMEKNI